MPGHAHSNHENTIDAIKDVIYSFELELGLYCFFKHRHKCQKLVLIHEVFNLLVPFPSVQAQIHLFAILSRLQPRHVSVLVDSPRGE